MRTVCPSLVRVSTKAVPVSVFSARMGNCNSISAERTAGSAFAAELLPDDRPHYLMGVGTPPDLLVAIGCGVDMSMLFIAARRGR